MCYLIFQILSTVLFKGSAFLFLMQLTIASTGQLRHRVLLVQYLCLPNYSCCQFHFLSAFHFQCSDYLQGLGTHPLFPLRSHCFLWFRIATKTIKLFVTVEPWRDTNRNNLSTLSLLERQCITFIISIFVLISVWYYVILTFLVVFVRRKPIMHQSVPRTNTPHPSE